MAGPIDITQSAKVREINKLILVKYGSYIPREKRSARFRVLQYADPAEYQKALQKTAQTDLNRRLAEFRLNQPDLYAQALKLHGPSLPGQLRGLDYFKNHDRYQKATFTSAGFFDPYTNTIYLNNTDSVYIAHELFHFYSYSRDAQGPYSYFEKILKQDIAEGVIESLGLEVGKAYARTHNLARELKDYEKAEMPRVLISKGYMEVNSISTSAVLHLLFEGWFRYDEKKGFVPAERITPPQDLRKFSAKETQDWQNAYRWLVPSKGSGKPQGSKIPGSTIPKSAVFTGLSNLRPGSWQGLRQFGPNDFFKRFSELQRQRQEQVQRHSREEARRRMHESMHSSRNLSANWAIQEREKKRLRDQEKRRLEEEARRRDAEQRRARELEARRALEEATRRNQEAARRRAAMEAIHNKRNIPPPIDHWKYKPNPNAQPWPWVHVYQGGKHLYSWKPTASEILCRLNPKKR